MKCKKIGCDAAAAVEIRIVLPFSFDGQNLVCICMFDCSEHAAEITDDRLMPLAVEAFETMGDFARGARLKDVSIKRIPIPPNYPEEPLPAQEPIPPNGIVA